MPIGAVANANKAKETGRKTQEAQRNRRKESPQLIEPDEWRGLIWFKRLSQSLDVQSCEMTDFIATSLKYYILRHSNGKANVAALDTAKPKTSSSKPQEPVKAKVGVEDNGNSDDLFARNQKELQEQGLMAGGFKV